MGQRYEIADKKVFISSKAELNSPVIHIISQSNLYHFELLGGLQKEFEKNKTRREREGEEKGKEKGARRG